MHHELLCIHGKGLVEVHVADIASTGRRVRETDLGVQVRTVEVDLAAVLVDDVARLPPIFSLEHRREKMKNVHPGHRPQRHRKSTGT